MWISTTHEQRVIQQRIDEILRLDDIMQRTPAQNESLNDLGYSGVSLIHLVKNVLSEFNIEIKNISLDSLNLETVEDLYIYVNDNLQRQKDHNEDIYSDS